MADIVIQCKVGQEKQRELEEEQHRMQEDHQEHQQQMIIFLQKVSNQLWKDENMYSESMPVIEREYPTPPVSQTRIAIPVKLNNTPNLPMCSGQEPVPSTEGSMDQWLFQVEGALATHTEEVVRSAVIGSVRGAACEFLTFIGYVKEMDVISRHIKECFGQGSSKEKLQKEFFLMEQQKLESINQFTGRVEQHFK